MTSPKILILFCLIFLPLYLNAKTNESKSYIIVVALESEIPNANLEKYAPIVYTGVGKVNAAIKLYEAILKYKPELVINYGTAGSLKNKAGLFRVNTFIQRDMDVRALGFSRGVTPFANEKLPKIEGIVLGTGDSFVTNPKKQLEGLNVDLDLVDMEGFALNKVCEYLNIEFHSYKNVSDTANDDAANDWEKNAAKGAKTFKNLLEKKYGISNLLIK